MFCTKCGNQIKDGFKFCPKCGTPVYVEIEKVENEVKAQVEEVKKETTKTKSNSKKDIKAKEKTKSKTASSSRKTTSSQSINPDNNPYSLFEMELDIDGVKKKAKQGDKAAILRQAFRYEMGIGVEMDKEKAEKLYYEVGGKNVLFSLEDSYANCVLPDSYYGLSEPEKRKANSGFYFKTLPFVKDLLIDYAIKVNSSQLSGNVSEKQLEEYKEDFVVKILALRDRYPEYLFVNYDNEISEEEAAQVFDVIKKNSSKRYSLSWLPSLFYFSDYIDGNRIEIPNVLCPDPTSDEKKLFVYGEQKINDSTLLHLVYNVLLQLPIKKVHFTFCCDSYEEVGVLFNNLDSSIYDIVCSEEEFELFSKRLEKRKREIIKKYGAFQDYCEKNETIPLPYEFVVNFFPDYFYKKGESGIGEIKLCESITFGKITGVYLVEYQCTPHQDNKYWKNLILNSNKNELYTDNSIFDGKYLVQKGIYYGVSNEKLLNAKQQFDSENNIIKIDRESDCLDFRLWWKAYDRVAEGAGEYEVGLQIGQHPENKNLDYDESYNYVTNLGLSQHDFEKYIGYDPDGDQTSQHNGGRFVLKSFNSEEEAISFVKDKKIQRIKPTMIKTVKQRIRLVPYYASSHTSIIEIALYVPDYVNLKEKYKEDLKSYFAYIGFPQKTSDFFINWISNENNVIKQRDFIYNNIVKEKDYLSIVDNGNKLGGDGYFFPDFLKYKYSIETNFFGQPKNYDEVLAKCKKDIISIEKDLVNYAQKTWGKNYAYEHLIFSDAPMYVCRFDIKKVKHYKLPIMSYRQSHNDGIIRWTPITENKTLLKACVDYINSEAQAKEEMQVQTLEFGSAAESKYETDLSTMTIPVGKAETKDADFRMDLVSHVHSFIIGQSGSGKSVFLHNIIGGAMLKYAPEDLQLYLLDFKLGGVEFNRYQGAKHVKALLVDNSDPQVTLEILRELRNCMTERGKLLRGACVNNIGEYNKLHQQDRMPHVLVVADECHEMFKADDSIPRQVRNEISDIVIKIAKEGRSQGVHLVFATQTLSGTEISSEIINNVSDFYLLKCAQTDSERLVPNSSTITSELSTGQIYYHHVDEQVKFQAYYTDKQASEKLMAAIVEKAKDHKSNGEFYFNGAQMFYLDEAVKEQILNVKGKSPVAFLGKAIDISQKDMYIKLNEDFSENVLLLGLNDQEQVTRTTMNLFVSLMMSAKLKHKDIAFKVIDCLNNEEGEVHELIFDLENEGLCEIIERRQRSKFFKDLAQGVLEGTAEETILLILGQDRFRELKMDMELEDGNSSKASDDDDMMSLSDDFFGGGSSSSSSVKTYKDALNVILEKGPDYGVHTLLQIEKASNLLFEDYITPKVVFQKFKHLVMLKSEETAGVTLHLNDDIRLEKLSSDWDRLRAYYYAEESDNYTLFTPYMPSKSKDIINLLKTL